MKKQNARLCSKENQPLNGERPTGTRENLGLLKERDQRAMITEVLESECLGQD
jgi:hypothetical protein